MILKTTKRNLIGILEEQGIDYMEILLKCSSLIFKISLIHKYESGDL